MAVIVTLNICHINNSVSVGNDKCQAMQWIAPKQIPTSTAISGENVFAITITPKHWHPVFVAQVDKTILKTHDKHKYLLQAIANCLPSQFLWLWDRFFDRGPPPAWLTSQHSNRPIDVERFIPPEDVYHKIHGCICKCDDFKMCEWKVFDAPCNALYYKPQCLK